MNILDLMNPPVTMEIDLSGHKCELLFKAKIMSQEERAEQQRTLKEAIEISKKTDSIPADQIKLEDIRYLLEVNDEFRSMAGYLVGARIDGEDAKEDHIMVIKDMIRTNHPVNGVPLNDQVADFLEQKGLITKDILDPSLSTTNSTEQNLDTKKESTED